jgi:hypothetical protein
VLSTLDLIASLVLIFYLSGAIVSYRFVLNDLIEEEIKDQIRHSWKDEDRIHLGGFRFEAFIISLVWFIAFPVRKFTKAMHKRDERRRAAITKRIREGREDKGYREQKGQ